MDVDEYLEAELEEELEETPPLLACREDIVLARFLFMLTELKQLFADGSSRFNMLYDTNQFDCEKLLGLSNHIDTILTYVKSVSDRTDIRTARGLEASTSLTPSRISILNSIHSEWGGIDDGSVRDNSIVKDLIVSMYQHISLIVDDDYKAAQIFYQGRPATPPPRIAISGTHPEEEDESGSEPELEPVEVEEVSVPQENVSEPTQGGVRQWSGIVMLNTYISDILSNNQTLIRDSSALPKFDRTRVGDTSYLLDYIRQINGYVQSEEGFRRASNMIQGILSITEKLLTMSGVQSANYADATFKEIVGKYPDILFAFVETSYGLDHFISRQNPYIQLISVMFTNMVPMLILSLPTMFPGLVERGVMSVFGDIVKFMATHGLR